MGKILFLMKLFLIKLWKTMLVAEENKEARTSFEVYNAVFILSILSASKF